MWTNGERDEFLWNTACDIMAVSYTHLDVYKRQAFLATFVSAVPFAATAPALVAVGVMMTSSFKDIEWSDFNEAVPAFFAGMFMALCYSISYGIAAGFIFYCIIKIFTGKAKEVHPILWVCTGLFILNFILLALL